METGQFTKAAGRLTNRMPGADKQSSAPREYQGREQAFIKHELLKAYLEKLFLIVGMSSSKLGINELCYVDCFSGPWWTETEDLADTSIGVSLRILEKCKKELRASGIRLGFRALYVEKQRKPFSRLQKFLAEKAPSHLSPVALHGDFLDLRSEILTRCPSTAFAFFFIDPTGWKKVGVDALKPLLLRRQSEFLINFMYEFISRTASMGEWKAEMTAHFGEEVDVDQIHGVERERVLVDAYRRNLMRHMAPGPYARARSAHVRILDARKERPKYHLIYLTSHPRGLVEFMEISEKLDHVQKRVRATTKQADRVAKSHQEEMFSDADLVDSETSIDLAPVELFWIEYLAAGERRVGVEEYAQILENHEWFPGDLQRALGRLIDAGKVRNLDAKGRRPKHPLHWKEGERLALVETKR